MKQMVLPPRPGINSELIPYYCGTQDCLPHWNWGPGIRDHFIFHYVKSGKGSLRIKKQTYEMGAGSLFMIPPHEMADYQADATIPWSYLWIGFSGLNTQAFVQETGFSADAPVKTFDPAGPVAAQILGCLEGMVEASESRRCAAIKLTGLLYSFIATLIEANAGRELPPGDENAKELYVRKAAEFVYMNYSREITVEDIAAYIGIGRKYLHSIFSELTGTSPSEFLINYRLHKACELMRDKTLQISDVAHSVGYPNPLNFSRIFHKVKGISPREYREKTNAYLGCQ